MTFQIPTPGPGEELVLALVEVEHDRVRRVPGADSQFFVIDVDGAGSLERCEAIKRGDEVMALALLYAAASGNTGSATQQAAAQVLDTTQKAFEGEGAVTLADVADATAGVIKASTPLFDPTATLAELTKAQALATELTGELELARATLAERDADLVKVRAEITGLQASQGDAGAGGADAETGGAQGDGAGGAADAGGDTSTAAATAVATAADASGASTSTSTPAKKTPAAKKAATKAK